MLLAPHLRYYYYYNGEKTDTSGKERTGVAKILRFPISILLQHLARVELVSFCLGHLVDEVNSVLDGGDSGSLFLRDLRVEFLFNSHDQFDGVKGVGTEVIDEGSP
jgi:hypothetical protein